MVLWFKLLWQSYFYSIEKLLICHNGVLELCSETHFSWWGYTKNMSIVKWATSGSICQSQMPTTAQYVCISGYSHSWKKHFLAPILQLPPQKSVSLALYTKINPLASRIRGLFAALLRRSLLKGLFGIFYWCNVINVTIRGTSRSRLTQYPEDILKQPNACMCVHF